MPPPKIPQPKVIVCRVRPLIGISLGLDERGRFGAERQYQYLETSYARAVAECGGTPVYLPVSGDAGGLLERLDGLLLPGGGDFAPTQAYPQSVDFDLVPEDLLGFDRGLLADALERELPVLGICYGMQLLALQCGGSLHHHIPEDVPEAGPHQLPRPDGRHPLQVEPGTRLAEILGEIATSVNSRHHQAVAEVGAGLRISARADDGVIEAVERDGARFCVGVQWHPEGMPDTHRDRLFGAFLSACRE